jgi:hypothetical protein
MQHDAYKPILSMTQVRQAMQNTGSHFFDRDTMRSFQSRTYDDVYPTWCGTYFITSEKDRPWAHGMGAWESKRRYTVRFVCARPCGDLQSRKGHEPYLYMEDRGDLINTSDDPFGRFATLNAARTFARKEQARLGGHPLANVA